MGALKKYTQIGNHLKQPLLYHTHLILSAAPLRGAAQGAPSGTV